MSDILWESLDPTKEYGGIGEAEWKRQGLKHAKGGAHYGHERFLYYDWHYDEMYAFLCCTICGWQFMEPPDTPPIPASEIAPLKRDQGLPTMDEATLITMRFLADTFVKHDHEPATKRLAEDVLLLIAEVEQLRAGLKFIDVNLGYGGNGEGWLASDNSRVTKALLGDASGRFPLTAEDWERLNFILGWKPQS